MNWFPKQNTTPSPAFPFPQDASVNFARNEPVLDYAPGSPERAALQARLAELGAQTLDLNSAAGSGWPGAAG